MQQYIPLSRFIIL